jgi:hypothetical protein
MSRNTTGFTLSSDQIAAIDNAVGALENQLQDFLSLTIDERRGLAKMGAKSEAFCRQTINALRLYPQIVPPSIAVGDAQSDLALLDQLRPIFQRLHHLSERSADTELALGSGLMTVALKGYRALKSFGRGQGLENLSREIGESRFTGKPSRPAPAPVPVPAAA